MPSPSIPAHLPVRCSMRCAPVAKHSDRWGLSARRNHCPNASHRANQGSLRAISSIHDSLQRTVVQTDAATFDTLGTAIWHFESCKSKTNLAILVGLRQLPDCLRACRSCQDVVWTHLLAVLITGALVGLRSGIV